MVDDKPSRSGNKFLTASAVALLAIGCLSLVAFIPAHWTGKWILNTDNWVKVITPIPKDATVSNALGSYIVSTLISPAEAQQKVAAALPDKAAFLAGPITDQVISVAKQASQGIVSSDQFQDLWVRANRAAHERLMNAARSSGPLAPNLAQLQLKLQPAIALLNQRLGRTGELENATNGISVNVQAGRLKLDQLRSTVRTIDNLNALLPYLAVATLLAGLVSLRRKRRALMVASVVIIVCLLLQLIGVKILRPEVLNLAQQQSYRPAIGVIYDSLLSSFRTEVYIGLALVLLVFALALCAGSYAWAVRLRQGLGFDRLETSTAVQKFSTAIAKNRLYVWAALLISILAVMAFWLTPSWVTVVQSALVWVAIISALELIIHPVIKRTNAVQTAS